MMGERADRRPAEIAAVRAGVELGRTLIDTAEMYGDSAAERLVAEALRDIRDSVFLVSKADRPTTLDALPGPSSAASAAETS